MKLRQGEHGSAIFSTCERYRYDLTRFPRSSHEDDFEWRLALWVMLNPSTADEHKLDPTLRRVRGFTERAGLDGFVVCNLYGYRATQPSRLLDVDDPVGTENAAVVERWLEDERVKVVVAGWGSWGRHARLPRSPVRDLLEARADVQALGFTATGEPRHPLYVSGATPFEPWR